MPVNEKICGKDAMTLACWPDHDPLPVCPDHHAWMVKVGGALGLYIPTTQAPDGSKCSQVEYLATTHAPDGSQVESG